jgi:hypothetical protein
MRLVPQLPSLQKTLIDKYIGFNLDINKTTEYESLTTVVPYGEIWYVSEIEKLSSIVVSTEILYLI